MSVTFHSQYAVPTSDSENVCSHSSVHSLPPPGALTLPHAPSTTPAYMPLSSAVTVGEADAIRTCGTLRAGVSGVTFGPLRALWPGVSLGPRWSLFSFRAGRPLRSLWALRTIRAHYMPRVDGGAV